MRPPEVCVALPVKNGGAYFAPAIESVLAQEGPTFEVRIIDNRSDDDSVGVAQRYAAADPRVSVAVNAADVFYYGSLNRALAQTHAPLFVPFAADDLMRPGNLARKVEALRAAGAGFAHSPATIIDSTGTPVDVWPDHAATPRLLPAPEFFERLIPRNAVSCQSVVARTDALRAIGGFDGRSYYAADWLAWMRLALRLPVVTLHEELVANRVHAQTGTSTAGAAGLNGRDVPMTLDRAFLDAALPETLAGRHDAMVALSFVDAANTLSRSGILRIAQGWAGYMAMGRAVARVPHDAELLAHYGHKVTEAGLAAPAAPWHAVAPAPADAAAADALAQAAHDLAPLLGRLSIAVAGDALPSTLALLEPGFGRTSLDVEVVGGAELGDLLVPGRLALLPWGDAAVAAVEAAGLPVFPYDVPDPFARRPDPARWETVDAEACLP